MNDKKIELTNYGDYIKNYRYENNLLIRDLGEIIGVDSNNLSKWEKCLSIPSKNNQKKLKELIPSITFPYNNIKIQDNSLGTFITKSRIKCNYTQLELSKLLKCGEKTLRRWESNEFKPNSKFKNLIEKVLEINLNKYYRE